MNIDKNNKSKLVKMSYYTHNDIFTYDIEQELSVGDNCIVQINDDLEFATVVKILDHNEQDKYIETQNKNCSQNCSQNCAKQNNSKSNNSNNKNQKANKKTSVVIKKILHKCSEEDNNKHLQNQEDEKIAFDICKEKIAKHNLKIKLVNAHYYFNKAKLLFEFVSETRIDFRELVKDLASHFHTRIELRQIGVRDEAKILFGANFNFQIIGGKH